MIQIDTKMIENFAKQLNAKALLLDNRLKEGVARIGLKFLNKVEENIIANDHIDTGILAASFMPGGGGNILNIGDNGLSAEVGTTVPYASAVDTGHRIVRNGQTIGYVDGSGYFSNAVDDIADEFGKEIDIEISRWFENL